MLRGRRTESTSELRAQGLIPSTPDVEQALRDERLRKGVGRHPCPAAILPLVTSDQEEPRATGGASAADREAYQVKVVSALGESLMIVDDQRKKANVVIAPGAGDAELETRTVTNVWMQRKLTDYWDTAQDAIDRHAAALESLDDFELALALREIESAVAEHVRVCSDETMLMAAVPVVDDLYRWASATQQWGGTYPDYLEASAATFFRLLRERGYMLQYLVDNCYEDLSRPLQLFEACFSRAGLTYVCPPSRSHGRGQRFWRHGYELLPGSTEGRPGQSPRSGGAPTGVARFIRLPRD